MSVVFKLGLLLALLLVAGRAAAQATGPARPATTLTFRAGSYQLRRGGDWQRAKLAYDAQGLHVSVAGYEPQDPVLYPADSVRGFSIGRDTFSVMRAVDIPAPAHRFNSLITKNLYYKAGFLVAEYVEAGPAPQPPLVYLLLAQAGQLRAVLPPNNTLFRLALSKALSDYPALSHQLELDPNILPKQLPELLTAYGRWKSAGGKP